MKKNIKILMAVSMVVVSVIAISGCWSTKESNRGGIAPVDQEFSIIVPSSVSVRQGEEAKNVVSLKRGSGFKQDVKLEIKAFGINVSPGSIMVKASDSPEVEIMIKAENDSALGNFRVLVKGTPANGQSTSTEFTVKVVSE